MRCLLGLLAALLSGFVQAAPGPLTVSADAVFIQDQETKEIVFAQRSDQVRPIASITKLMSAWVVFELQLPMDEKVEVETARYVQLGHTRSRLRVGWSYTREQLFRLSLTTSDNLAAYNLAVHTPVGIDRVVQLMNEKALKLGMLQTTFTEPTGLSADNTSTPEDLAKLLEAISADADFKPLSAQPHVTLVVGKREVRYNNTNPLVVMKPELIDVSKTGYIRDAGGCVITRMLVNGRPYLVVLLHAPSTWARIQDLARVYEWLGGIEELRIRGSHKAPQKKKVNRKPAPKRQ